MDKFSISTSTIIDADGSPLVLRQNLQNIREIKRITMIGLIVNLVLSALKFAVGIIGASQAVAADAFHSLSDSATDIILLIGLRYWSAPADEKHPYGHGRIETVLTAALGLGLVVVALAIGYRALVTVRQADIRQPEWIAFIGAAASIVLKEALYRWTIVVGRRAKSSVVIANAWEHRSDAFGSVPAALAVVIALVNPEWSFIDHIGALVVSLIILRASWNIIRPALDELIDSDVPEHIRVEIKALATHLEGVKAVHAIRCRRSGPGLHVDLHVIVDGSMSVHHGHEISEAVKRYLVAHGPDIVDVVVHLEPTEPSVEE